MDRLVSQNLSLDSTYKCSGKGTFDNCLLRVEMMPSRFNKWYLYSNLSDDRETHGDIADLYYQTFGNQDIFSQRKFCELILGG